MQCNTGEDLCPCFGEFQLINKLHKHGIINELIFQRFRLPFLVISIKLAGQQEIEIVA